MVIPSRRLVKQQHDVLLSLKEEIEAIDNYNVRISEATNEEARDTLRHFIGEEMEHACMALEWLRLNMPGWDGKMREILFKGLED